MNNHFAWTLLKTFYPWRHRFPCFFFCFVFCFFLPDIFFMTTSFCCCVPSATSSSFNFRFFSTVLKHSKNDTIQLKLGYFSFVLDIKMCSLTFLCWLCFSRQLQSLHSTQIRFPSPRIDSNSSLSLLSSPCRQHLLNPHANRLQSEQHERKLNSLHWEKLVHDVTKADCIE